MGVRTFVQQYLQRERVNRKTPFYFSFFVNKIMTALAGNEVGVILRWYPGAKNLSFKVK
jgi:hypothetical protein